MSEMTFEEFARQVDDRLVGDDIYAEIVDYLVDSGYEAYEDEIFSDLEEHSEVQWFDANDNSPILPEQRRAWFEQTYAQVGEDCACEVSTWFVYSDSELGGKPGEMVQVDKLVDWWIANR